MSTLDTAPIGLFKANRWEPADRSHWRHVTKFSDDFIGNQSQVLKSTTDQSRTFVRVYKERFGADPGLSSCQLVRT